MSLAPGHQEVVYSQSEKIGLPNWSFFTILVSAKTSIEQPRAQEAWAFLCDLVDAFTQERAEVISRDLNLFHGVEGAMQTRSAEQKLMIPQTGKALGVNSELTYSQTEVIGLPEKASINYLASSKMLSGPGQEIDTYRYLAGNVANQMFEKRAIILANHRPWTVTA